MLATAARSLVTLVTVAESQAPQASPGPHAAPWCFPRGALATLWEVLLHLLLLYAQDGALSVTADRGTPLWRK